MHSSERFSSPENLHLPQYLLLDSSRISEKAQEAHRALLDALSPDAADQLLFILKQLHTRDFVNHCNGSVAFLAEQCGTSFGDEPSFFAEAPDYTLFDFRAKGSLERAGWRGDFHSVGVFLGKNNKEEPAFIILDPMYATVHQKRLSDRDILLRVGSGDLPKVLRDLHEIYGGSWRPAFSFADGKKKYLT